MTGRLFYGWIIVGFTVIAQALGAGIVLFAFPLYVVEMKESLGVPLSSLMLAIVFMQLCLGFFATPVGYAIDRYSPRSLVVCGSLLLTTGLVMTSFVTAPWQYIALHSTILPVGLLLCGGLMGQILIVQWFEEKRGLALGISATGTAFGGVIFPLVIANLIGSFGWRESYLISGIVFGPMIALLGWYTLRRLPSPTAGRSSATVQAEPARKEESRDSCDQQIWTMREILKQPVFWFPVLSLLTFLAIYDGVKFNLGDFMSYRGYSPEQAAVLITIVASSQVIGKLTLGYLADLVPHRFLIWLCSGLYGLCLYILHTGFGGLPGIQLAVALMGFAGGAILPMRAIMLAANFGPQAFSRVLGLSFTFVMLGGFGRLSGVLDTRLPWQL